jgi:hypothetical protein
VALVSLGAVAGLSEIDNAWLFIAALHRRTLLV